MNEDNHWGRGTSGVPPAPKRNAVVTPELYLLHFEVKRFGIRGPALGGPEATVGN
jgi:hypothetical protein